MKRSTFLSLSVVLCLFLSCSKGSRKAPSQSEPEAMRTLSDQTGAVIHFPQNLQRVALFGGPSGQIALLLGAEAQLCAVTNTFRLSPLVKEFFPRIADLPAPRTVNGSINLEELVSSRAQLVIAGRTDGELVKRRTGIPVAMFDDSMDSGRQAVIRDVRFYAQIFNTRERGEAYVRYLQGIETLLHQRLSDIEESRRLSVYNGFSMNHLVTLGGDTFFDEHIRLAGCRNASESVTTLGKREGLHSGLGQVSMEQVLSWDPDLIVLDMGDLASLQSDSRWASISAVRKGRVVTLPSAFFIWNRPTAESAALYPLWLAFTAYPHRFTDMSLKEELKTFYREIFHLDFTDRHIETILRAGYRPMIMKGRK